MWHLRYFSKTNMEALFFCMLYKIETTYTHTLRHTVYINITCVHWTALKQSTEWPHLIRLGDWRGTHAHSHNYTCAQVIQQSLSSTQTDGTQSSFGGFGLSGKLYLLPVNLKILMHLFHQTVWKVKNQQRKKQRISSCVYSASPNPTGFPVSASVG